MKLTKAMEDHMNEEIQKLAEREELSDDMLEAAAGGRSMTAEERQLAREYSTKHFSLPPHIASQMEIPRKLAAYTKYITSLPEGSPEEFFDLSTDWNAKLSKL